MIVNVEIVCDEPVETYMGDPALVRRASLQIAGVTVFTDVVYDTDPDGNRTEAQARKNLLLVFQSRLRNLGETS